jgi:phospholipid/cholesterol/gamma-HCH transport system substrate-binding protein
MEKSRLETKVGLFVLVGLVLLAVLLIQFSKGTSVFRGTYELRLHASNVGGLKQRAGVLLSGVQVGGVSDIQLAEDGKSVTIVLKIYKECKIYHDARFVIESANFLGDQYVAIVATSNSPPRKTERTSPASSHSTCRKSRARLPASSSGLTRPPKNWTPRSRICGGSC